VISSTYLLRGNERDLPCISLGTKYEVQGTYVLQLQYGVQITPGKAGTSKSTYCTPYITTADRGITISYRLHACREEGRKGREPHAKKK
jgi:hypothetical protein